MVGTLTSLCRDVPTRTSDLIAHPPTVFANAHLRQTRVNEVSGCCANKVIINLSTAIVIPDYSLYYSRSIDSFQPSFYAFNDGSLVAPPFIEDLSGANVTLLVTGMLAMLFLRNIIVSGDYLRRGKVKRKVLFYILFFSQLLAPLSIAPVIMSYFSQRLNCSIVSILSTLSATVSLALLITGILGVKAYKCLNNSRSVLIILALFEGASSGVVAMDIATIQGERRLTGSCVRVSGLLYARIFIFIQFMESLFICLCFMYACWKSRGSASARGRISIRLSMEDSPIEVPMDYNKTQPTIRGWWNCAPNTEMAAPFQPQSNPKLDQKFSIGSKLIGHKGHVRTRPTAVVGSNIPRPSTLRSMAGRATSPAPSSLSRLGRFVPTMGLFRKVMKDELLYTTFITATCVVVTVLAVIGVNFQNILAVTGLIALNWSIISLLAIHSFGRVVHRHERDALLQHPATCNAIIRAGNAIAERKQPEPPISLNGPQLRYKREVGGNDKDDLFSDTRRLRSSESSWDSHFSTLDSPSSPSLPVDEYAWIVPAIRGPSPHRICSGSFPTSGRSTPLVPHQSMDEPLVQVFSQSWLLDRAYRFPLKKTRGVKMYVTR